MSAKVWLVDEDLSVRESLGFLLRALEYDVADFADLASFEAATQTLKPLQGCLLLDACEPDASSLRWLVGQADAFPLLPVIVMTGKSTLGSCHSASHQGAFALFTKPLEIEALLETLRQAMQESELRAQRG